MNAQLIILITILLAVFVILLGYATWRIRHRQPYLTVGDNPMMSPFSDEQKQHMRQLRARNRDALREVAGVGGVYGFARPLGSDLRVDAAGPSGSRGTGGSASGSGSGNASGAGNGHQPALARWNGLDEGRNEAGRWV